MSARPARRTGKHDVTNRLTPLMSGWFHVEVDLQLQSLSETLELADDRVRVPDEPLDDVALAPEDTQHSRCLTQPRVRATQDVLEVVGPARQAGPERRDDQPEALAVRTTEDVVDQVERDRGLGP